MHVLVARCSNFADIADLLPRWDNANVMMVPAVRPSSNRPRSIERTRTIRARNVELKNGSPRSIRSCPHAAPMCLYDRTTDRQSHAHAVGLGRVERIEHVLDVFRA